MPEIAIGPRRFLIEVNGGGSEWTAEARCADSGESFGPVMVEPNAEAAERRLTRWLQWQHGHAHAIEVLQQAERAYHRLVAGRAFAPRSGDDMSDAVRRAALQDVETARRLLDAIRATRPR